MHTRERADAAQPVAVTFRYAPESSAWGQSRRVALRFTQRGTRSRPPSSQLALSPGNHRQSADDRLASDHRHAGVVVADPARLRRVCQLL